MDRILLAHAFVMVRCARYLVVAAVGVAVLGCSKGGSGSGGNGGAGGSGAGVGTAGAGGAGPDGGPGGGPCANLSCDDGNPCTDDSCGPFTGCIHIPNTLPCDDGNACTAGDACSNGVCTGRAYSCDDGIPCTRDFCNGDGTCRFEASACSSDAAMEMHVVAPIEDGCTAHYSPTVMRDPSGTFFHMWTGGWRNCAEAANGNDEIFHARSSDLSSWTFDAAPVIASPSMHYNDPSVVQVPDPGGGPMPVFLMYLTGCGTVQDCFSAGGNRTFGAVSFDGVTWSAPALVVGTNNGYDNLGAWSPSAVLRQSGGQLQIYLYYHNHDGVVLRSTINAGLGSNLFAQVGTPILVLPGYHLNVNVTRTPSGQFELTYDAGNPFSISRMVSTDGANFFPDPTFATLSGAQLNPPYRAFTSHEYILDSGSYWLFFGWGAASGPTSPHGWRFVRTAGPR